jgi:hypothetical protein
MLTESIIALLVIGICVVVHCGRHPLNRGIADRQARRNRTKVGTSSVSSSIDQGFCLPNVASRRGELHLGCLLLWARTFGNYETALYFSLGTYTTIGYGDVLLPQRWRLVGSLEGISGVLMCGLSTAFLFAVVNALFQFRIPPVSKQ